MTSSYRVSANKRRDQRQAKINVKPPSGGRKDTKRWCRGKVGVEHTPVCVDYNAHKNVGWFPGWKLLICSECKRQLDSWMPVSWCKDKEPPEWVR